MYQDHVQATSFRPTTALSCDEVDSISLLDTIESLPFKVESSISLLEAMEPLPFKVGVPCDDWAYLAQSLKKRDVGFLKLAMATFKKRDAFHQKETYLDNLIGLLGFH